jgi:hypothetical protein
VNDGEVPRESGARAASVHAMPLTAGDARDALSALADGLGRGVLLGGQAHALREAVELGDVALLQLEDQVTRERLMTQPFL